MLKLLANLLLLASITTTGGCREQHMAADVPATFKPAQGLIVVTRGSLPQLQAAITEYDGLVRAELPGEFPVEVHPQPDGRFAVLLPQGLPAYDLVNMTVWLDAPPHDPQMGDTVVWIRSPADGVDYHLQPERENAWGDTLIGTSEHGQPVRVTAPETGLSPAAHHVRYQPRPTPVLSPRPLVLKLTLDTPTGFGNPDFRLTDRTR